MRIELIDLDKYPLVIGIEPDGTATVYARDVCDIRAAAALRQTAAALEAGHPPYSCQSGAPVAERPTAGEGWYASDLLWVDSSGRPWDLTASFRSAGNLLWHWTGRMNEHGVPLMCTATGSTEQSLDVVRALYAPIFPTGGRS